MPCGAVDHIADTVDQPHLDVDAVADLDLSRLLRDKFGLCRRDRAPAAALRQFILRASPLMFILDLRQHHQIHKALYKSGFSRPNRSHHSYIDLPASALADIPV